MKHLTLVFFLIGSFIFTNASYVLSQDQVELTNDELILAVCSYVAIDQLNSAKTLINIKGKRDKTDDLEVFVYLMAAIKTINYLNVLVDLSPEVYKQSRRLKMLAWIIYNSNYDNIISAEILEDVQYIIQDNIPIVGVEDYTRKVEPLIRSTDMYFLLDSLSFVVSQTYDYNLPYSLRIEGESGKDSQMDKERMVQYINVSIRICICLEQTYSFLTEDMNMAISYMYGMIMACNTDRVNLKQLAHHMYNLNIGISNIKRNMNL